MWPLSHAQGRPGATVSTATRSLGRGEDEQGGTGDFEAVKLLGMIL